MTVNMRVKPRGVETVGKTKCQFINKQKETALLNIKRQETILDRALI